MSGVDDEHVDAGADELGDALLGIAAGADGGAREQSPLGVLARVREVLRFRDVLDGDHAAQLEGVVDDEDLLDAMAMQLLDRGLAGGVLGHRHESLARAS